MKSNNHLSLTLIFTLLLFVTACNPKDKETDQLKADEARVTANIKMYSGVWDQIINESKLNLLNDSNFTKDVIFHASPQNIIGTDSAKAYFNNYLTGFSDRKFVIHDIFGQGEKLVKHWTFKGRHTGVFFGIKPTGKDVIVEGVTLVRMVNGKIAEEQDFMDNLEFMQQIGLIPR